MSEPASGNRARVIFLSNSGSTVCSSLPNARLAASRRTIDARTSIGSRLSEAMRLSLILLLFATLAAFGQDTKLYVVTHVDLTPNYIADGTPLLLKFAADSRKEKGVARFELLQEPG